MQGLGFRVRGLGFGVWGSGFRVQGLGLRVYFFEYFEHRDLNPYGSKYSILQDFGAALGTKNHK